VPFNGLGKPEFKCEATARQANLKKMENPSMKGNLLKMKI
jgi:hypothetical protein